MRNFFVYISISIIWLSCGNPVTPSGGPKDTASPIIQTIKIDSFKNYKSIQIEFDENIQVKGSIKLSPLSNPIVEQKGNKIKITVPNYTRTVFIKDKIVDLNESNPYRGKNISLTKDSLQMIIQNQIKDSKLSIFINVDSNTLIPYNHKNNYQFENLKGIEKEVYIINKDNNNYKIDSTEEYNIFSILPDYFKTTDTIQLNHLIPRIRKYDKKIKIDSNYYKTTQTLKHYSNRDKRDILFCKGDTCTFNPSHYSITAGNQYILINNLDTAYYREITSLNQIVSNIPSPILLTKTEKNKSSKYISLGKLNIVKTESPTNYLYMYNEINKFLIHLEGNQTDSLYLPIGKYITYSSINPFYIGKDNQPSLKLYKYPDEIIINNKLDNNLILPKKELYNDGITFK